MDPWEVTMVAGLRQEIVALKEELRKLKAELQAVRTINAELTKAVNEQ